MKHTCEDYYTQAANLLTPKPLSDTHTHTVTTCSVIDLSIWILKHTRPGFSMLACNIGSMAEFGQGAKQWGDSRRCPMRNSHYCHAVQPAVFVCAFSITQKGFKCFKSDVALWVSPVDEHVCNTLRWKQFCRQHFLTFAVLTFLTRNTFVLRFPTKYVFVTFKNVICACGFVRVCVHVWYLPEGMSTWCADPLRGFYGVWNRYETRKRSREDALPSTHMSTESHCDTHTNLHPAIRGEKQTAANAV